MRSYVLSREPAALRADLGTGAADVARIVSEVRDRAGSRAARPTGDPEDDRWRLLQAVDRASCATPRRVQPLLLVLEDLHGADRGTLDLLLHLARNLEGARLLVVGTYRDVEVDRAHPLSGALAELRRAAPVRRAAAARAEPWTRCTHDRAHSAARRCRRRWSRAVHRQTEGNPLFVQEVLRYLVEEGLVVREERPLRRPSGDDALREQIPEGLRDVIGKRLSRLSAECNRCSPSPP